MMRWTLRALLLCAAAALCGITWAQQEYAAGGSKQCIACHDFGPDSPVRPLLAGAHGQQNEPASPMSGKGCESCHGPSAAHTSSPMQQPPGVSFGPRWQSDIGPRDHACLACHGNDTARHWGEAPHQAVGMACGTCHEVHTVSDPVLSGDTQAAVCTRCHRPQQQGVHALAGLRAANPPCTACHNPHEDRTPREIALNNRSQGCRSCHDLVQMAGNAQVSDRAKSYHKVMAQEQRTCLDCHQGIAHHALTGQDGNGE